MMNTSEYRDHAIQLLELTVSYMENIREHQPCPIVKPGFLKELVPSQPPQDPEAWKDVFDDIERFILKSVSNHLM